MPCRNLALRSCIASVNSKSVKVVPFASQSVEYAVNDGLGAEFFWESIGSPLFFVLVNLDSSLKLLKNRLIQIYPY